MLTMRCVLDRWLVKRGVLKGKQIGRGYRHFSAVLEVHAPLFPSGVRDSDGEFLGSCFELSISSRC